MAMFENLDDGEFWLPPQFLSDDDNNNNINNFESKNKKHNPNNVVVDEAMFRSEFPFGFFGFPSSNLSSPLGGSSETESDEEEHHQIAEFTRFITRSNLEPDFNNTIKPMGKLVSGSPQSTLCAFGIGCGGCRKGSSQSSPNSVCKLSSARATWDLLHAAAGKVERMRLNEEEETYPFQNGPFFAPQSKTSSDDVAAFYTQQSLSHQKLQIAQFEMLRQQQMAKQQNNGSSSLWGVYQQQRQSKNNNQMLLPNRVGRNNNNNNNRNLGLSASAWPSLQHAKQIQNQQQFGSSNGMRAVFLGGGGRRECAGTGVFLPLTAESRNKPACSTALVPDRVLQALNRKMENGFNVPSNMENVAVPRLGRNYSYAPQKNNIIPQPSMNHEIRLPQEWTY
ncbi:hypothetical protein Lal_00038299 [Lupinus albus]|uniref:Uncharacterized protein n=1 Tax=Lupinus albus TaxID=3870 RepID=A0A6A4NIS4_LUPAL|nr:hypothetical protein Lalb_Chr19g0124971 [Lupinus albus]KAF1883944.1 hypothetical protein Lal_00038299 [Lupinus albus]